MGRILEDSRFTGPAVRRANTAFRRVLVHAKDPAGLQRSERWLAEFAAYARLVFAQSGLRFDLSAAFRSVELMRLFLSDVVRQDKGTTVPGSARRFLSAERLRRGHGSLNEVGSISTLMAGVERSSPRTKKKSAPLHEDEVGQLLEERQGSWFERQVATMAGVGFLTVMRLVELRTLRTEGVRFVLHSGEHVDGGDTPLPRLDEVKAVLFHVAWRKQHQAKDVWVPMSCPRMTLRVLEQLQEGRRQGCPDFLFPSVSRKAGRAMHMRNRLGRDQFQTELQSGLIEVCKFKPSVEKLFTGHALRVGGSSYMRRLGLSDEVHRKLGGWMSIESSQGYMVLSPHEQARVCEKMALARGRTSAFSEAEIPTVLKGLSSLVL
jgi:hypothetical protein